MHTDCWLHNSGWQRQKPACHQHFLFPLTLNTPLQLDSVPGKISRATFHSTMVHCDVSHQASHTALCRRHSFDLTTAWQSSLVVCLVHIWLAWRRADPLETEPTMGRLKPRLRFGSVLRKNRGFGYGNRNNSTLLYTTLDKKFLDKGTNLREHLLR